MDHAISRARWAALGAAVAVALGGGIGITHAALGSGERTAYVPINPCRLADSRPGADHVGDIAGALAEDASVTLVAHGPHGNCDLPTDAAGLALNVTAVDQTRLTYLTLWPADAERPKTSNLNPAPGQPPTPNAVTVDLDAAGRFSVYNRFGTVDIVVDVVGYYADHHHDDRYYTKADTYTRAEVDAAIAAAVAGLQPDRAASVIDRTLDIGVTTDLLTDAGLTVTGVCDADFVRVQFHPGDGGTVWFYGTELSSGDTHASVRLRSSDQYTETDDDYLHVDGLLWVSTAEPQYYQVSVQAHRSGTTSCLIWMQMTPGSEV